MLSHPRPVRRFEPGESALRKGELQKAKQKFTHVAKHQNEPGRRAAAELGLAKVAFQSGALPSARSHALAAYKLRKSALALLILGNVAFKSKRFAQAIDYYERVLKSAPLAGTKAAAMRLEAKRNLAAARKYLTAGSGRR